MAAEVELGIDPLLDHVQTELLEACDRRLGKRVECKVGERRPMPERLSLAEGRDTRLGVGDARHSDELEHPACVELAPFKANEIAGRLGYDAFGGKQLPKLRNRILQ